MLNLLKTGAVITSIAVVALLTPAHAAGLDEQIKTESFTYSQCINSTKFQERMGEYKGTVLTRGPVSVGEVFTVMFEDTSFGNYIFLEDADSVCLISSGWFIAPVLGDPA